MSKDRITLYGSTHAINEESNTIDVSLRLNADQARRINQQAPEAMSLQEGIRCLLEDALAERERRITPLDVELAVNRGIGDVQSILESGDLKVKVEGME